MQYTNGTLFANDYSRLYSPRMNLAKRLDEAMKVAHDYGPNGISQSELSRKSGVPQATISRTLKGATSPETDTIRRLAAALGVTFDWLNEGIQPKHRTETKPQSTSPVSLASNNAEQKLTPEQYAEVILLFGKSPPHAQREVLRILSKAVKAGSVVKGGGSRNEP